MKNENKSLYIPMGVKSRSEIFEGYGKEQVIQTIIATVVIILVAFLIYSFNKSVSFVVVFILVGIAATIMCVTKDKNNQSIVDHFKNMMRFFREQQKYKYKYLKEWGDL